MLEEQLSKEAISRFALLGRSYLVNTDYVLRIQPSKQLLTFRMNKYGTIKKICIKATAKALQQLEVFMEKQ
jgi:DNA-binding LytR/AlgR family response regulator